MLKFLVPSFIKNIDKTLLLNYPFWYIVKLHYIMYFTVLMWLMSYLVGYLLPIDINSYSPENVTSTWIFGFSILGVILFCVWMYYLTIYNNEDHFGKFSMWDDTKLLFVLLIGLNLLMSFSYPMQVCFKSRLANVFTDKDLAQQYNALNLGNKYVTSNIDDFQYCGYNVHDTINYETLKSDTNAYGETRYNYDLSKYKNFKPFSPENDERLNFNLSMMLYGFPKSKASEEFKRSLLNEKQIEHEYMLHKTNADILKAIQNYFAVNRIYQTPYNWNKYTDQDYFDNYNHIEKKCSTYFPEAFNIKPEDKSAESNAYLPTENPISFINNIYEAKFSLPFILTDGYLLFCFYFSFFISLLIILFRNNKWQHYLVSAVSFILLSIMISIVALAFSSSASPAIFPSLSLLIYFIAGGISLNYYFKKDKYRVVGAIATNLFYFGLPIIPFFICIYAHDAFDWLKCHNSYSSDSGEILECMIYDRTYKDALFYSQLAGIISFIVLAMPFYKLFFAKQKALPKDK